MTGVPLVTPMFPGVMNPVPLAKTAVKVVDAPDRIDEAPAVKLVITGVAGATPTDVLALLDTPAELMMMSVYLAV